MMLTHPSTPPAFLRTDPPGSLARRAVDGVLAAAETGDLPLFAGTLGMSAAQYRLEMRNVSPESRVFREIPGERFDAIAARTPGEFHALVELLFRHRNPVICMAVTNRLARAIASACFGHRHLWEDLGLADRGEVSELIEQHFPALYRKNAANLRWKRLIFAELGVLLGDPALLPPGCDQCGERNDCHRAQPLT